MRYEGVSARPAPCDHGRVSEAPGIETHGEGAARHGGRAGRYGSGRGGEFKARWTAAAAAGPAAAAATTVLYLYDPARYGFYPSCPLYACTHLQCAGCGTLRAAHALLHGRWLEALSLNALATLAVPAFAWIGAGAIARRKTGRHLPLTRPRPAALWLAAIAALAYSVARNIAPH
jgi:hypothetical protein